MLIRVLAASCLGGWSLTPDPGPLAPPLAPRALLFGRRSRATGHRPLATGWVGEKC